MSAFAVTSADYLRAAQLAHESPTIRGFFAIALAVRVGLTFEAWKAFRETFDLSSDSDRFVSAEHCVLSLLLMAEICRDEENEEEGQL